LLEALLRLTGQVVVGRSFELLPWLRPAGEQSEWFGLLSGEPVLLLQMVI
jgi:hypothetical protein